MGSVKQVMDAHVGEVRERVLSALNGARERKGTPLLVIDAPATSTAQLLCDQQIANGSISAEEVYRKYRKAGRNFLAAHIVIVGAFKSARQPPENDERVSSAPESIAESEEAATVSKMAQVSNFCDASEACVRVAAQSPELASFFASYAVTGAGIGVQVEQEVSGNSIITLVIGLVAQIFDLISVSGAKMLRGELIPTIRCGQSPLTALHSVDASSEGILCAIHACAPGWTPTSASLQYDGDFTCARTAATASGEMESFPLQFLSELVAEATTADGTPFPLQSLTCVLTRGDHSLDDAGSSEADLESTASHPVLQSIEENWIVAACASNSSSGLGSALESFEARGNVTSISDRTWEIPVIVRTSEAPTTETHAPDSESHAQEQLPSDNLSHNSGETNENAALQGLNPGKYLLRVMARYTSDNTSIAPVDVTASGITISIIVAGDGDTANDLSDVESVEAVDDTRFLVDKAAGPNAGDVLPPLTALHAHVTASPVDVNAVINQWMPVDLREMGVFHVPISLSLTHEAMNGRDALPVSDSRDQSPPSARGFVVTEALLVCGESASDAEVALPADFTFCEPRVNLTALVTSQVANMSSQAAGENRSEEVSPSGFVFLAVRQCPWSGVTPSPQDEALPLNPTTYPLLDAALVVVARENETSSAGANQSAGGAYPELAIPEGYSAQVVDVQVPLPTGAPEAVHVAAASPVVCVRIVLLQCADAEAVAAMRASGGGVQVGGFDDTQSDDAMHPGRMDEQPAEEMYETVPAEGNDNNITSDDHDSIPRSDVSNSRYARRAALLDAVHAAALDSGELSAANLRLQAIVAALFSVRYAATPVQAAQKTPSKTGGVETSVAQQAPSHPPIPPAQVAKLREIMKSIAAEKARAASARQGHDTTALALQHSLDAKAGRAAAIEDAFNAFKREVAVSAAHSRTGERLSSAEWKNYEISGVERTAELVRAQLRLIHAQAQLQKSAASIPSMMSKSSGPLGAIDYEQLKIENATLMEQAESRAEELSRLRKKTASAVQVLTHLREKLHCIGQGVERLRGELRSADLKVASQRASLAVAKAARESTRARNTKAAAAQSFAHDDALAADFEKRRRAAEQHAAAIAECQERHGVLLAALKQGTLTSVGAVL